MNTVKNLTIISAILATSLGSTVTQAATIGAAVGGGLWAGDFVDGGIESNYAYVEGNQSTAPYPEPALGNYSYRAEASFNASALTPQLRTIAISDDISALSDPFISAEAYAFQTYQNTSNTSQTYTLNLSLHGILNSSPSSRIDTVVSIYTGTDMFTDYTQCGGGAVDYLFGFNTYICGSEIGTGFSKQGIEMVGDGENTMLDTVSFTIAAGETFTTYASLEAYTTGGSADAFSTLGMSFEDTSTLRALGVMPSPVPVPAAVWLFGSGLVGLIGFARRKQRT